MKKVQLNYAVFIILITLTLIASCIRDENSSPNLEINDKVKNDVLNLIESNLNNEYNLLTNYDQQGQRVISKSLLKDFLNENIAVKDIEAINDRRENLSLSNVQFIRHTVHLDREKSSLTYNNNEFKVKAVVNYQLPTNSIDSDSGNHITTEGVDFYDYSILKLNYSFKISEKNRLADFPNAESSNEDLSNPSPLNDNYISPRSPQGSYSYTEAVDFAITKYNDPPKKGYYDYSSYGGDCTNFVSHCLKAGGWAQENKWHWLSNGISCDTDMKVCTRSPSWTGAYKLYEYLTNSGSKRVNPKFIDIKVYSPKDKAPVVEAFKVATTIVNKGDIIQMSSSTAKSSVFHSTFVTSKDSKTKQVFVTYRNATGYAVAKDKFIGDFTPGKYLQGFSVKSSY